MKHSTKLVLVQVGGSAASAAVGYMVAPSVLPMLPLPQGRQGRYLVAAAAGVGFYVLLSGAESFLKIFGLAATDANSK